MDHQDEADIWPVVPLRSPQFTIPDPMHTARIDLVSDIGAAVNTALYDLVRKEPEKQRKLLIQAGHLAVTEALHVLDSSCYIMPHNDESQGLSHLGGSLSGLYMHFFEDINS